MNEECVWHDFGCEQPAKRRDDGTFACSVHQHVHVSDFGSWVQDRHGAAS